MSQLLRIHSIDTQYCGFAVRHGNYRSQSRQTSLSVTRSTLLRMSQPKSIAHVPIDHELRMEIEGPDSSPSISMRNRFRMESRVPVRVLGAAKPKKSPHGSLRNRFRMESRGLRRSPPNSLRANPTRCTGAARCPFARRTSSFPADVNDH